ncbi:uncharacterized protein LOC125009183 [Mugil cephalus]|uniref:uncharacterized protein LOC125009183 n=1 Tax=Mugil cephalus TaxID=48193 RepID=UPI001FB6013B|nr:uncharacterized protein LOC125009183 [Mugil cephalus]
MAVPQGPFLAAVLLLVSSGLSCSASSAACPQSCTCQRAPLLNCSSSGLSSVPWHIQDSVTELDLSHNLLDSVTLRRPYNSLRSVWLGNNSITHLSLCVERKFAGPYLRGRPRLGPQSGRGCVSWAPKLQLLSAERNQLIQLPEGLESMESLQVLQLSFNRISTLQPGDFRQLRQLRELNLKHNLITTLHPQMFQDLIELRVLDLSFNMLTSLNPLMHLTLRNFGADVRLAGNRWQCDCSMRSLRRRMVYDSSRGFQAWKMVCASPATLSGRELIQLEEDDLNCFTTDGSDIHQDVTVYSGSEILLTCSKQDSVWWTPSGQASVRPPQAGLFISDITEKDTGLYVCMSEEQQAVSVFNLQISKVGGSRRRPRSLPQNSRQIIPQDILSKMGEERNQGVTQCNLTLAVCLSVFITFLIAFILGVLARPCIDVLWKRVTRKKRPASNSAVSPAEQIQYENEAYFNDEGPEELGPHRERRITFSDIEVRGDNNVQYYDTVVSENSNQQSSLRDIPDRRSLSSSSDSSVSENKSEVGQMTQRGHTPQHSPQLVEDSIQQAAAVSSRVPQISIESNSDSDSERNHRNPADPDLLQENEELFEFSDSVRSTPARSSGVYEVAHREDEERRDDTSSSSSSSSSYISDDEPTVYIVNPYQDTKQEASFEQQNQNIYPSRNLVVVNQGDYKHDTKRPAGTTNHSSSSDYSDSDQDSVLSTTKQETLIVPRPMPRTNYPSKSIDNAAPAPRKTYSSSSSESEGEIKDRKVAQNKGRVSEIKKRLDTKAPSLTSDSSSSSDSEDETTMHIKTQGQGDVHLPRLPVKVSPTVSHDLGTQWPTVDLRHIPHIKRRLDIKPARPHSVHNPEKQWPNINLGHTTSIKRSQDIKAPSPASDSSSSSDSEDETTMHMKTQGQGDVHLSRLPVKVSPTVSHDLGTQWPTVDLRHIPHIKRRLDIKPARPCSVHNPEKQWPNINLGHTTSIKRSQDIKAPSTASDSSSSSDSEDEATMHIKTQGQGNVHLSRLPVKVSPTVSHGPGTQWPTVDLQNIPHIKRRLDIKPARPRSVHNPEKQWPAINLGHTTSIKRSQEIKAPSPASDSSSSSDSEDEATMHIKTQGQGDVHLSRLPVKVSPTLSHGPGTQWPTVDLQHIPHIKRRLDIKPARPRSVHNPEKQWPAINLGHTTSIKRRG